MVSLWPLQIYQYLNYVTEVFEGIQLHCINEMCHLSDFCKTDIPNPTLFLQDMQR